MASEEQTNTQQNTVSGTRVRNFLIAIVAIVFSVALVLGLRTETTSATIFWIIPVFALILSVSL